MDLYPEGYVSLDDYYWGESYFPSWLSMINTALCIVEGFKILHNNGLSYQDINHGGFRVNPSKYGSKGVQIMLSRDMKRTIKRRAAPVFSSQLNLFIYFPQKELTAQGVFWDQ